MSQLPPRQKTGYEIAGHSSFPATEVPNGIEVDSNWLDAQIAAAGTAGPIVLSEVVETEPDTVA